MTNSLKVRGNAFYFGSFLRLFGDNQTIIRANSRGYAVLSNHYYNVNNGYYAFTVTVDNADIVAISYVSLTVSLETRLNCIVQKQDTSNVHVFYGKLENVHEEGGLQLTISVNGSVYTWISTDEMGLFYLEMSLLPENDTATTYDIQIAFGGWMAGSVTSYHQTSNGTYPVCTTIYSKYKPSCNVTRLTVSPPSTDTLTPTKTPEEMQAEAEEGGWLSIWHEFSWWYPWYRLRVKINVNPTIDVGFNPLLPFGETWNWEGLELFANVVAEIWDEVILDFMGVFISYTIAKGLSIWNWAGGLLAEIIKGAFHYALFLAEFFRATEGSLKMLAAGIAEILMGLIAIATNIGEAFVKALKTLIFSPAISTIMLTTTKMINYAAILRPIRTLIDYVECGVDFSIAILALLRYLGWI